MTIKQGSILHFFEPRGKHAFLANFSRHRIVVDDITWPTVEHFYQAQKFVRRPEIFDAIRIATTPAHAKRIAQMHKAQRRADWKAIKQRVMRRAITAKFEQHEILRKRLVATGDAKLVESADDDLYWGAGRDGSGQNKMGKLLMQLRARFPESIEKDWGT